MGSEQTKFIVIEPCDFVSHPAGGQLNFARLLLRIFPAEIATVGYAESPDEPVGVWFRKETNDFARDHFNLSYIETHNARYWIPARLKAIARYWFHRRAIHAHTCKRFFIQEHAILMAFHRPSAETVCYRFPGVGSQLSNSRFSWAVPLARIFDYFFYRATRKADVLLASADEEAISKMRAQSFGFVVNREVISFPTRVDTSVFTKKNHTARHKPVRFVSCGRLHRVKGWDLMLDALALLRDELDFSYTYIGDGPDREAFLAHASRVGLADRVILAGFLSPEEIAALLRVSDVFLMGSHMEGWPTTLVEAYVTGLPLVATAVSGASAIVKEGTNGFICRERHPGAFTNCIRRALTLDPAEVATSVEPERFSISELRGDLHRLWLSGK